MIVRVSPHPLGDARLRHHLARYPRDGKVGAAMETQPDFAVRNGDVGRHVDKVAEDQARLGVVVATHAACHETVETGGEDEERHVEVDLEADG